MWLPCQHGFVNTDYLTEIQLISEKDFDDDRIYSLIAYGSNGKKIHLESYGDDEKTAKNELRCLGEVLEYATTNRKAF